MSKLWLDYIGQHTVGYFQTEQPTIDCVDESLDIDKIREYGLRVGMTPDQIGELAGTIDDTWGHVFVYTNGVANYNYAIYPFLREAAKIKQINEIDYTSVIEVMEHLQRKDTFTKGHLTKVEYFETFNKVTNVGTNKVLQVDMVYTLDASAQTDYRTTTRKWYLRDNTTIGVETVSVKYYNYVEGVKEGVHRRANILDGLKVSVPGLIMATANVGLSTAQQMGIPLFSVYSTGFKNYVEVKDPTVIMSITNDTTFSSWLNNQIGGGATIRSYIINEMTY
jgi:hypothetical protein